MDADAGENGHVIYALEPDTRSSSLLRIDPATGSILLVDQLPVSDVNTTYDVTVIARDAGLPVQSTALRLTIMVCNVQPVSPCVYCAKTAEPFDIPFVGRLA